MERKTAINFLWVIFFVILAGSANLLYWKYRLNKEGVYVIGWRIFLSTGGETGTTYTYKFFYHGKEFKVGQSGTLYRHAEAKDTLLYFRILPADPDGYCDFLTELNVPKCFKLKDVPYYGWEKIPLDTCIYNK